MTIRLTIESVVLPILKTHGVSLQAFRQGPVTDAIVAAYREIRQQGVLFGDGMLAAYLNVSNHRTHRIATYGH